MIRLKNLTKKFKGKIVLDKINLEINKGEVVALVGPNGAGKSTLISSILGLLKPTDGKVMILGKNPEDKNVKEKLGVMLQEDTYLSNIKVGEVIDLFCSYYKNPLDRNKLIEVGNLKDIENIYSSKLSGGEKRRLTFALAMCSNPELIFLDEPTTEMDVTSKRRFWEVIEALTDEGKTVILTSHNLEEVEKVATRIIIIKEGRIIKEASMNDIRKEMAKDKISFKLKEDYDVEKLQSLKGILKIDVKFCEVVLYCASSDEVLFQLIENKIPLKDIYIEKGKLCEIFESVILEEEQ